MECEQYRSINRNPGAYIGGETVHDAGILGALHKQIPASYPSVGKDLDGCGQAAGYDPEVQSLDRCPKVVKLSF
jgi:hypothetical protein